uniref:Conserved oligomeric Golgi complex subunit 8 n=1 Tax=Panagrellus redivivus TaxID=6233 RepID=A0A7E4VI28_PANRE
MPTDSFDEQLGELVAIEQGIQKLSLSELLSQRSGLNARITHLGNEISDLAFNNYRTYADAGRTAEHCKEMFSNVHKAITSVRDGMPELNEAIKDFGDANKAFHKDYESTTAVTDPNNPIWKILNMPKMMHQCIRTGEYESAFALTDYAVQLKHSRLYSIPMVKRPVDFVIEARHGLLDELFNKFSGPIDLTKSIQVVNNIRKIPYISNTQLRVSILQYRDIFLDNQITKVMTNADYIYKVIDVFRDCMYDTMVLYLAVFPDSDLQHRRLVTSNDPRWERWTGSSQNYLLQAWAHKNLEHLFDLIRSYPAVKVSYEALREKLMSFASSFGRMGLDFRLLITEELRGVEIRGFKEKVAVALHNLISKKTIHLVDSEIVEMARSGLIQNNALEAAALPLDMIAWDDLVIYANEVITSLNDLRYSLSVNQLNDLFEAIQSNFSQLLVWVDSFLESDDDAYTAKRAARIIIEHFVPFMQGHLNNGFALPLHEKWRIRGPDGSVDPFVFKLESAAYEPSPPKSVREDVEETSVKDVGHEQRTDSTQLESSIASEKPGFGGFANVFTSHMQSIWSDEPIVEHRAEAGDVSEDPKLLKTKELNERFEKAIKEYSAAAKEVTPPVAEAVKTEESVSTASEAGLTAESAAVESVEAPMDSKEDEFVVFDETSAPVSVDTSITTSAAEAVSNPSTESKELSIEPTTSSSSQYSDAVTSLSTANHLSSTQPLAESISTSLPASTETPAPQPSPIVSTSTAIHSATEAQPLPTALPPTTTEDPSEVETSDTQFETAPTRTDNNSTTIECFSDLTDFSETPIITEDSTAVFPEATLTYPEKPTEEAWGWGDDDDNANVEDEEAEPSKGKKD